MENVLFFDLETTGLDCNKHSIIEIAAEFHVNGKKVSSFCDTLYNEKSNIDLGALKVNKYALSTLQSFKNEKESLYNFCDWLVGLNNLSKEKTLVCGHNPSFDVNFIKSSLNKYGIEGWDSVASYRLIDTCDRARMLINAGIIDMSNLGNSGASLSNIAKSLGILVEEYKLHKAHYDVELTSKVYYKMEDLLKSLKNKVK